MNDDETFKDEQLRASQRMVDPLALAVDWLEHMHVDAKAAKVAPKTTSGVRPASRHARTSRRENSMEPAIRTNAPEGRELVRRHTLVMPSKVFHLLFDKRLKGVQAQLTEGRRALVASGGYCCALLQAPCTMCPGFHGSHMAEFLVGGPGGGGSSFGMAAAAVETGVPPGHSQFSVGLRRDGKVVRDGETVEDMNRDAFGAHDHVLLVFDADDCRLTWFVNGARVASIDDVPPAWHFAAGRHGNGKFSCRLVTNEADGRMSCGSEQQEQEQEDLLLQEQRAKEQELWLLQQRELAQRQAIEDATVTKEARPPEGACARSLLHMQLAHRPHTPKHMHMRPHSSFAAWRVCMCITHWSAKVSILCMIDSHR